MILTTVLAVGGFAAAMVFLAAGILFSKKTRLKGSCHSGHKAPALKAADGTPLTCDHCSCPPEVRAAHHPELAGR